MITLKGLSGKKCVYCNSTDTANARVRGERELSGPVCKEHVWKLLDPKPNWKDEAKHADEKA
ncbi:MAG: hypothetical protein AB7O68_16700 [Pirellulales bacterium]